MTLSEPRPGETLGFDIDDGTGLRVARAKFESEHKFSWSLFDGYDRIRILTYSAGVGAIDTGQRMMSNFRAGLASPDSI